MKHHQPANKIRHFLGFKPKRYSIELDGKQIECIDLEKSTEPCKGEIYTMIKPFKQFDLWAYYDPLLMPAGRWLGVSTFIQLATAQPTDGEAIQALAKARELKNQGNRIACDAIIDKAGMAAEMTGHENKWLNLASGFLIAPDESPLSYEGANRAKIDGFKAQPPGIRKDICNWTIQYFTTILENLKAKYPQAFQGGGKQPPFLEFMATAKQNEENLNIAVLQMAGEDVTKTNLITNKSLDEYFRLMTAWSLMNERKIEAMEKIKKK